jgi:large subunit ribosomal protein L24
MANSKINIKKGDLVEIICGGSEKVKTKGKRGKVQVVIAHENRVIIENLNMVKKSKKPRKAQEKGGIIDKPRAIDISNVMLVCPECSKRTRIGHTLSDDGKKYVRQCKKCQAVVDKKGRKDKKAKTTDKVKAEKAKKSAAAEVKSEAVETAVKAEKAAAKKSKSESG